MCEDIVQESNAPYRAASIALYMAKFLPAALVLAAAQVAVAFLALASVNVHASWLPDPSARINNGFEFSQPSPPAVEPAPQVEAPASLQRKASVAKHKAKARKPAAKKKSPATRPVTHPAPKPRPAEATPIEAPMPSIVNPYNPPKVEAPVTPAPKVEAPVKRKAHFWSCDPSVKHHFFKFCDAK